MTWFVIASTEEKKNRKKRARENKNKITETRSAQRCVKKKRLRRDGSENGRHGQPVPERMSSSRGNQKTFFCVERLGIKRWGRQKSRAMRTRRGEDDTVAK